MKAIVQDRYGSPDVLSLAEVQTPTPAADEVLVKVHAAAVNARDWHVMRGDPYIARLMDRSTFGREGPKIRIMGTDFAGRVEALGQDVRGLQVGDEVFGESRSAFAEYVSVPQNRVARKPAVLTFEEAAAVPLAGITALVGLRDVQAGQRLLINGASGGVGTFAVQIAKASGAHVTGVCSTRNVDMVRSLGADEVVDYKRDDFAQGMQRYDVVLDLVGNRSLRDLRRVLTPRGTLILSGGGVSRGGSFIGPVGLILRGAAVSKFIRHRLIVLSVKPSAGNLSALADLAESGQVRPVIDRMYPLAEAPDAIRYIEGEHARAKVVLIV
jgi:NADPH:quinone reductase-like Zn-dependent oxidoreductase